LAASFVLDKVLETSSTTLRNLYVPTIQKVKIDQSSETDEYDIASLMNLWKLPNSHIPHVQYTPTPSGIFKPKILIVGDSFSHALTRIMTKNNLYNSLDLFYYYNTKVSYPTETKSPIEKINWEQEVLSNDLIIINFTEPQIQMCKDFIEDLYKVLTDQQSIDIDLQLKVNSTHVQEIVRDNNKEYQLTNVESKPTGFFESGKLNLTPGKKYELSFKTKGKKGTKLAIDLFPDTLPQYVLEVDKEQQESNHSLSFNSNDPAMRQAVLRFFVDNSTGYLVNNLLIYDIRFSEITTTH
jgi:hypothetical protein